LNSTISGNTAKDNDNGASGFGGGAGVSLSNYASGAITIIDSSTISGNRVVGVAGGGGVFVESKDGARATISNTTISGNEAEIDGGGLMMSRASHGGSLEVLHSTITNNRADSDENATGEGGGLNRHGSVTTTVTLHHTILSGNEGWNSSTTAIEPDNILGTIDGGSSFNLLGSNNGSFSGLPATTTPLNNIHSDTPGLAALSGNGGLTATHRLLWNSIARDAGDPSYSGTLGFDQRGAAYERVFGGAIDIGAYEYNTLRITDVVLENASVSYSFAKQSWLGDSEQGGAEHRQLRPVFYGGLDRIEVHFSKPVNLDGDPLTLRYDQDEVYDAARTHTVDGLVVTWTFSSPLPDSKFAINIDVTKVRSSEEGGQSLDGEWDNSPGFNSDGHPTLDDWSDDPKFYFPSGNGIDGSTDSNRDGVSEFRFNFAILAGDYDGTGAIEVDELISGDGNGDGVIDALDAIGTVGDELPLRESDHDYYDDDVVAARDLSLWESAFGTHAGQPGYDLRVDFDSDDDVDGTDFLIWQASYASTRSAWWYGSPMVNWPASVYAIGVAPQVVNVVVSGSESQHSAFSMSSVSGSGDQLRPVPVGGADTLSLVFNNEVNIVESDLTIVGLTTGNIPRAVEFVYDILTRTATWRFENLRLTGDLYLLSLSDAVTSSDGIHLDGEWVNPASISTANPAVSDFADGSGDTNPGGVFNFVISLLPGDANLDGIVAAADSAILLNNWGITGAAFANGDFNGDGDVDGFQWPNEGDSQLLSQFWATDLRSLWILADLDSDYDVDGDDIDILVGNLGLTGALWSDGDLDGDGEVTVDDRDIAWAMYGMELDVVS
jgi:hypothetical protein